VFASLKAHVLEGFDQFVEDVVVYGEFASDSFRVTTEELKNPHLPSES
jgi:hypothetical protein